MHDRYASWFNVPDLAPDAAPSDRIQAYREALKQGHETLQERFEANANAKDLVKGLSWLVDQLLGRAWQDLVETSDTLSLVAVGGYGRAELLPGSDIDLMVLLPEGCEDSDHAEGLQAFLTFLWDIGMEVGHSVRTPSECAEQAVQDVTIITNLIEARHVAGSEPLFDAMRDAIGPDRLWSCGEFFKAKLEEQRNRHEKFHDTAYKLEPNIKESPGGLRDIQMIGWVAKRHFGADRLSELVTHQFLTQEEYEALIAGQWFLWRIRFALHFHTGRREDRLLFDHQRPLAAQLGYENTENQMAVEQFMGDYYRTVQELNRLNDMLLQLFKEAILHADDSSEPVAINKRFQASKGFLEVTHDQVFQQSPYALLELFLILQQHPELDGVRASTVRLIRTHTHLIDDEFRNDLRAKSLFMEIFRQPTGLTAALRKMNRYGVLAAYLPAFAKIVGQMQFDLFHIYTVDVHTLFLVRNLRRFTVPKFATEFPLCSQVIQTIPKPELLYLAGLFHDIAKGRGGDHSTLGAVDAYEFGKSHGLSEYDSQLIAWLVRNHLTMSTTAQRRDISDPAVVHEFAKEMGDPVRLDYLYLLTVADIRATSPELWNSWKDSLLRELFAKAKRMLRRGLEHSPDQQEQVDTAKARARELIAADGVAPEAIDAAWNRLENDYFLRHTPDEIRWQTEIILRAGDSTSASIELREDTKRGSTELFIYMPVQPNLFTRTTALLEQLGLDVADARIITSRDDFALDGYLVMENSGEPVSGEFRRQEILDTLRRELAETAGEAIEVTRRAPRQFQHFAIPTRIDFAEDQANGRSIVELITSDRPGLLSLVGQAFLDRGISLENARIATFGNRAEDVFYVVDGNGDPLPEATRQQLAATLHSYLDDDQETGTA